MLICTYRNRQFLLFIYPAEQQYSLVNNSMIIDCEYQTLRFNFGFFLVLLIDRDIKTPLLSMIAHDVYIDFIRPQGEVALPQYRRDYCRKAAVKLMPDIAAKLYLNQFTERDLTAIDKMTDELFKYET